MKNINLIFLVHERQLLKRYLFFDIGNDHYYYDDYANEQAFINNCENCYLPANRMAMDIIKNSDGKVKLSFAISGIALDKFERFAPNVIDSFAELSKTGCVEFLAMPYSYSLSSVFDKEEFKRQVKMQTDKIELLFGYKPSVLFNTAMIYSDDIGEKIYEMGFNSVIIEGAKHVLGWKSSHFIYNHTSINKLKLLVRDSKLSDDINYRFSNWNWQEYPLTADKFISWIRNTTEKEQTFNIMFGYEAIGVLNSKDSGIFDFFRYLPYYAIENKIAFSTPSQVVKRHNSVGALSMPYPVSWDGEEKDLNAYCGNELQNEALTKLYNLSDRINLSSNAMLLYDWYRLQDALHFYFMDIKKYVAGVNNNVPYESGYHAFMNYMNVLSDFIDRVKAQFPTSVEDEELNALLQTITNQNNEIASLHEEIKKLKNSRRKK